MKNFGGKFESHLAIRYSRYPKRGLYYHPVFNAIEINSEEELEAVSSNSELMRQQALLITERILGSAHKVCSRKLAPNLNVASRFVL